MTYPARSLVCGLLLVLLFVMAPGCGGETPGHVQSTTPVPEVAAIPESPTPEAAAPVEKPVPPVDATPVPGESSAAASPTSAPMPEGRPEVRPTTPAVAASVPTSDPTPISEATPLMSEPTPIHQKEITPPVAGQKPHSFTHHGVTIEDPWHWLRDPDYPTVDDEEVLAYLNAENAYFEAKMGPHKDLTDTIFEEIKGRQQPDLASVPWKDGEWYYQWKFAEESQYRIWLRWPADGADAREAPTADVETLLDEPATGRGPGVFPAGLAVGEQQWIPAGLRHRYGRLGAVQAGNQGPGNRGRCCPRKSPTSSADWSGLPTTRPSCTPLWTKTGAPGRYAATFWASPWSRTRWCTRRAIRGFFVGINESASREYILIGAGDHVTSEVRLVPAADPGADPVVVAPRRANHEYSIDHQGDRFIIRTNDTHKNTRLATAPGDDPTEAAWQPLVDASDDHYITGFDTFKDFIAVELRIDGLDHVRLMWRDGSEKSVDFPEEAYSASVGQNREFQTDTLRLSYASMVTPSTVFDYHIDSEELEVRQVQEVPSGYDASEYVTERVLAPARDGVEVPVSIVRHRDTPVDGTAPLYLYGYGAYGYAIPPSFSTTRLSLLDRGFIFAIAHIRGGDDLGYHWYEAGKLDRRTNTFNDFVDVARHLVDQGYVREGRIAIAGGSAGGQLMGAVVNLAPELWGAVAAHVPFVDVLNTMLDDSLPLTPIEWPEWGNPIADETVFEYIRSYSPYDQLAARDYPPILVTAGLNDPRVTYWEPAKYVAKLRHLKTDENLLLLKTNMGAGHGGRSGRYDRLYEVAEEYAFMLAVMGLVE